MNSILKRFFESDLDLKFILWYFLFLIPTAYIDDWAINYAIFKWNLMYLGAGMAMLFAGVRIYFFGFSIDISKLKCVFFILAAAAAVRLSVAITHPFQVEIYGLLEGLMFLGIMTYFLMAFSSAESKAEAVNIAATSNAYNAISSQSESLKAIRTPLFWGLVFTLSRVIFQMFECQNQFNSTSFECFPAAFGNVNMLAEYLIIVLPFLVCDFLNQEQRQAKLIGLLLSASVVAVLITLQSRSTLIGLVLYAIYLLLRNKRLEVFKITLGAAFILLLLNYTLPSGVFASSFEEKSASSSSRKSLYLASLQIVKDNPFGVGHENFEFMSVLYRSYQAVPANENMIDRTPHSEIIRWAVQYGIVNLLLMFVVLAFLLRETWRPARKQQIGSFILQGIAIVLLPQILFQFAFENAFPFVFSSIIISLLFLKSAKISAVKQLGSAFLILGVFAIIAGSVQTYGRYSELEKNRTVENSHWTCALGGINWRACTNEVYLNLMNGDLAKVIEGLKKETEIRPLNFIMLRHSILALMQRGELEIACKGAYFYNQLFHNNTRFHNDLELQCNSHWLRLNRPNSPAQFSSELRIWWQKAIDILVKHRNESRGT
jgi:hypothetical protein